MRLRGHVLVSVALGLAMGTLSLRAARAQPDAGAVGAPRVEPVLSGPLGPCTVTLTRAQYWRSAILGVSPGSPRSPDGFGPLDVSLSGTITCTSDARLEIVRASVSVDGGRARALRHPDRAGPHPSDPWDGTIAAGETRTFTFTWHDGPFAPRDGQAQARARFRVGRATLELVAPSLDVGHVS